MFKKVKEFCKENKRTILITSAAAVGGIVAYSIVNKDNRIDDKPQNSEVLSDWRIQTRKELESYGAEYRDGYDAPFATKEVAIGFLERGNAYQLDIFDEDAACIWIGREE